MAPVLFAQLGAAPVLLSLLYGVSDRIPDYLFYPLKSKFFFCQSTEHRSQNSRCGVGVQNTTRERKKGAIEWRMA